MGTSTPVCTIALENMSVMPRGDFSPPKGMKEVKPSPDKSYHIPWGASEFVLSPGGKNNFEFSFPDRKITWGTWHRGHGGLTWMEHLAIVRHVVGSPDSVFFGDVDGDGTDDLILMSAKYVTVVQNRGEYHLDGAGCTPWQAWKKPSPPKPCDHGPCDLWRRMAEPESISSCYDDRSYNRETLEGKRLYRECLEHQVIQGRALEFIASNKGVDPEERVGTVCHMPNDTEEQKRAIVSITSDSNVPYSGRKEAAGCHIGFTGTKEIDAFYLPMLKDKSLPVEQRIEAGGYASMSSKEVDDAFLEIVNDRQYPQGARFEAATQRHFDHQERNRVLKDIAINGEKMGFGLHYRVLACNHIYGDDRLVEDTFRMLEDEVMRDSETASLLKGIARAGVPASARNRHSLDRVAVKRAMYLRAAKMNSGKERAYALFLTRCDLDGKTQVDRAILDYAESVLPQLDLPLLEGMRCDIRGVGCREPESDI